MRLPWVACWAGALLGGLTRTSAATPIPDPAITALPFAHQVHVLKNGLQVILVPRAGTGQVAYDTLVRAGSRNEVDPGRTGFAHFFEHMMFRGTPSWPQQRYEDALKAFGASSNAYTDDDFTVFSVTGRAAGLETFVELEADRFQHLEYGRAAFETEARAVMGEFNNTRGNPRVAAHDALLAAAFLKHPYQHPTLGLEADLRQMGRWFDFSREFFRRYYTPDNCAVIVVGDFDPALALEKIARAYNPWRGKVVVPKVQREPVQQMERRVALKWTRPARPRVTMAWHTPASSPRTQKEVAVAGLLGELLFGRTSRLHQQLVLEQQLCEDLGAYFQDHRDPNLLVMGAVLRDADQLPKVEEAIDGFLAAVVADGVAAETLEAVKSHERYALLMQLEKDRVIADVIANHLHLTGSLQWMADSLAAQQAVTSADVQDFVRTWLTPQNRTVVTLVLSAPPDAP